MAAHYETVGQDDGSAVIKVTYDDEFLDSPSYLEKGGEVRVDYDDPDVEKAVDRALELGHQSVRRGLWFEIRGKIPPWTGRSDYGRVWKTARQRNQEWSVAWYFNIDLCASPEPEFRTAVKDSKLSELGGYLLIARIKSKGAYDAGPA